MVFVGLGPKRPIERRTSMTFRCQSMSSHWRPICSLGLDAFLEMATRHAGGTPLPAFVVQEFRDFLTFGVLAHDFARLRCTDCALERLVPFSCKGRGFCPSRGGRRMTERAARLVDEVLPRVPLRQWVLSLPYRLRYLLAWDHALARAVLGVAARACCSASSATARADTGSVTGGGGQ
jgi:hypothetical protein